MTTEDIEKLTDEERRVMIAEFVTGEHWCAPCKEGEHAPVPGRTSSGFGYSRCSQCASILLDGDRTWQNRGWEELPNYTTSLDAISQAEQTLTHYQADLYADHLETLLRPNLIDGARPDDMGAPWLTWRGVFQLATATAAQRALAFLRTVAK